MSNTYNAIYREFNKMAKENFAAYKKAEKQLLKAKEQVGLYGKGSGYNAETKAREYRARAEYEEALEEEHKALIALQGSLTGISDYRSRLEAGVSNEYGVRPENVDLVTIELLKSGVMRSGDYRRMLEDAKASNNFTMMKLISKYAGDAADAYADNMNPEAISLRGISMGGKDATGEEYLESFDNLASLYQRCVYNPLLIDKWDELVPQED